MTARKGLTVSKVLSGIGRALILARDVNAVRRGRIGPRLENRLRGRALNWANRKTGGWS